MEHAPMASYEQRRAPTLTADTEPPAVRIGRARDTRRSQRGQAAEVSAAVQRRAAQGTPQTDEQGAGQTQCTPPRVTYAVPPVVDLLTLPDPVARNGAINASYHAFGASMTTYMGGGDPLGAPVLANWCTYGQHASREAGAQIVNLRAALRLMADAAQTLVEPAVLPNPIAAWRAAQRVLPMIRRINALLAEPGLVRQSIQLALAKAGITPGEIQGAIDAMNEVATPEWSDLLPGMMQYEMANAAGRVLLLGARLALALPSIVVALTRILDNMARGNREIYENIAPAYAAFLAAGLAAADGAVSGLTYAGDGSGFLGAAFTGYADVRRLANEMCCLEEDDPTRQTLADQRRAKANEANLLIGYQEQLVILQPIFDTMTEELDAMDGTMVLRDPNGIHPLVPGWRHFYTRMGIDPARAPSDPSTIRPGGLPPLAGRHPSGRDTIADYFTDNVENTNIHNAPRPIRDH